MTTESWRKSKSERVWIDTRLRSPLGELLTHRKSSHLQCKSMIDFVGVIHVFEGHLGIDPENFERLKHVFGMLPSFQMICSAAWVFST